MQMNVRAVFLNNCCFGVTHLKKKKTKKKKGNKNINKMRIKPCTVFFASIQIKKKNITRAIIFHVNRANGFDANLIILRKKNSNRKSLDLKF